MSEQTPDVPSSSTPRRREPSLSPPEYVLTKHGSRVLDPATAIRLPGQERLRATVYVGARLLVRGTDVSGGQVPDALQEAARQAGLVAEVLPEDQALARLAREEGLEALAGRTLVARVQLRPMGQTPAAPPDAWLVLQNYRAIVGPRSKAAGLVSLDHLVQATADIEGKPLWGGLGIEGNPLWGGLGVGPSGEFGLPGRGGRAPVAWLGPAPYRRSDDELPCRRPVVAILDTGVGKHPWLKWPMVTRHPRVGTLSIGLTDDANDPELTGTVDDPLEGTLDPDAGHGTFIAGLIHQTCPDANIVSVRVMHGDGAVAEGDMLEALNRLLLRQAIALKRKDDRYLVDIISLSLGYYHESPSDEAFDHLLLAPLREFGQLGVIVVASAGNDATNRHLYPAGFAPHLNSELPARRNAVPVISVGARNPDDKTVALFSNQGDWVTCYRRGSAVISCMPVTFQGSLQPTARVRIGGQIRQTLDPDDYSAGFGTWSGTSFSAPILAGELAARMLRDGGLDPCKAKAAVDRAWAAITKCTKLARP
jgi:hypothetical protein